jgi:RNA polymerase sigma factor (sigma-70 family)
LFYIYAKSSIVGLGKIIFFSPCFGLLLRLTILFLLSATTTYTEASLIDALKKRDEKAFEYLYHNYKGALFQVVSQIIPGREAAGDVLQEVFITAWKNMEKYDPSKGRLFTWLLNVARNCAINTTRSKIYKSTQKNDSFDNYVNDIDQRGSETLNINAMGLRQQVRKLDPAYSSVLELSYFSGFTHEEIARILEIPAGTVKTRLRRAVMELRKQFV